jgi:hypothetical protein
MFVSFHRTYVLSPFLADAFVLNLLVMAINTMEDAYGALVRTLERRL